MRLRMCGATDRGLVRSSNQDSLYYSEDYGVAIVSDGMGGHKGGEIASALAVNGLKEAFLSSTQILIENVGSFLDEVLRNINDEILRQAAEDKNLTGMGATINYLQFAGGKVAIGHAGDSRTYLARLSRDDNGQVSCALWQLTIDHNVGVFVERGLLKVGSSKVPLSERQKSRLMRGMGVAGDLKSDLYLRSMEDGDVYLTCSDGLHGYVSDAEIARVLRAGPLEEAPDRLIRLAHSVGAPDNVTVVLSSWSEVDEPLLQRDSGSRSGAKYLVRMPSGHIRGPLDAEEVSRDWLSGEITFDDEVAASAGPWVFFKRHKELFAQYPEFDTGPVRLHVQRMMPASAIEGTGGEEVSRIPWWNSRKVRLLLLGIVLGGGLMALLARVVLEYIALQNTAY